MLYYVITAIVALFAGLAIGVAVGIRYRKKVAEAAIGPAELQAKKIIADGMNQAKSDAAAAKKEALIEAKEEMLRAKNEFEQEIKERRSELSRQERRVQSKEENLDRKTDALEKKEEALAKKVQENEQLSEDLQNQKTEARMALQSISGTVSYTHLPLLPYMDRPADTREGCKHRCTNAAMEYFKSEVMEMCHREGLYQIDLLSGSKERITEREYWAAKKGQLALAKENAVREAAGQPTKPVSYTHLPNPTISIVTFILHDDVFHGSCQILVLPGTVFVCEIFIEALAADPKHSAVERDFSSNPAVLCLQSQKDHSLVFADFRRLAAKKALASSRNSFSSLRRRISLSCSFTRLRSMVISSDKLIALVGVWEPSPISSLPALTAFSQVWMVPSGIPNSLAALAPPISLASFTACTLYSWLYLRATLNTSLFSWFYYEILENKLSTFFIPHHNG